MFINAVVRCGHASQFVLILNYGDVREITVEAAERLSCTGSNGRLVFQGLMVSLGRKMGVRFFDRALRGIVSNGSLHHELIRVQTQARLVWVYPHSRGNPPSTAITKFLKVG